MGRGEGESCASYLLYIIVECLHRFFSSSGFLSSSDFLLRIFIHRITRNYRKTFLLHGLRTEFNRTRPAGRVA